MAELFSADRTVIGKHLKKIFERGELTQDMVCAKNAHVASDGRTYETTIYRRFLKAPALMPGI
ncbi:hypothetical protein [Parasutterella secunda]|uniref:Uncharacterized protein n=1 Tax=Parasutterella secunda TaxID=626947 RepID=A0ABS2GVB6_9BURK|nr:hypothetical protein [Parasutterella secunda]MBM6929404.1 hypothetical protein [Parasutterella secunda]